MFEWNVYPARIVQLSVVCNAGSKHWTIYEPQAGAELPEECSGDLPKSALGEPVLRVTLRPGDILFLPRGFVHFAKAATLGPSTHLTVSTYQQWANYNVLMRCLETLRVV
jgi:ribosomal protein L16 Arg81 hydroxylase